MNDASAVIFGRVVSSNFELSKGQMATFEKADLMMCTKRAILRTSDDDLKFERDERLQVVQLPRAFDLRADAGQQLRCPSGIYSRLPFEGIH